MQKRIEKKTVVYKNLKTRSENVTGEGRIYCGPILTRYGVFKIEFLELMFNALYHFRWIQLLISLQFHYHLDAKLLMCKVHDLEGGGIIWTN